MFDWPTLPFENVKPWRRWLAAAVGLLAIVVDLTVFRTPTLGQSWWRAAMGLVVLAAFVGLGGGAAALGLRLRPLPDGRFWWRFSLWAGALAFVMIAVAVAIAAARDTWVLPPIHDAHGLWQFFVGGCVQAPITEELLYFVALCAPFAVLIGPWPTMVLAGVVFGLLHELWDNFAWTHPISGVFKGWVYLRSRCLWLIIAFHAFGNLLALAVYAVQLWMGAE